MAVKPLSPDEVSYEIPDFVIEAVNTLIKRTYRGSTFTIKAKDIIAEGRKTGICDTEKDWYNEKWMDFEDIFNEHGWKVTHSQPSRGDSDFDAYYTFKPKL
jgi:hypothetical protein